MRHTADLGIGDEHSLKVALRQCVLALFLVLAEELADTNLVDSEDHVDVVHPELLVAESLPLNAHLVEIGPHFALDEDVEGLSRR